MKFLWGHWKEGAARVRYLVVLGLVRAEATWTLGDVWLVVMRCSSGSQTMLGQLEWARGICPGRTQQVNGGLSLIPCPLGDLAVVKSLCQGL